MKVGGVLDPLLPKVLVLSLVPFQWQLYQLLYLTKEEDLPTLNQSTWSDLSSDQIIAEN